MAQKTILILDQGEYLGGAERFLSSLLCHLDQDYDIHLLSEGNADYLQLYEGKKISHHTMSMPSLKPLGIRSLRAYYRARQQYRFFLHQIDPDLVISNTVRTHLIASSIHKDQHTPLMWMAHDRTFPQWLLRWAIRFPQKILACSDYVRQWYRQTNDQIPIERLTPYGIEDDQLDFLDKTDKEMIVGMVGNFIPWKGQDLFIEAAQKLHEDFPQWRFQIIGKPYEGNAVSERYFRDCQQRIADHPKISIESSAAAWKDMANWRILVHCSREAEPLGRVILEGMAAQCAVIASRLGGPKEIVTDEHNALLIDPNSGELIKALKDLMSDEQKRLRLAAAGRAMVDKNYHWSQVIEAFKKFLIFRS